MQFFPDRRAAFELSKFSCVMAVAFFMMASANGAHADDRSFLALFEDAAPAAEQYPAGGEDMVATYPDGRDETENGARIARETPSTTREIVPDPTEEKPGTITVDTQNRYLYLSMSNGQAIRYGVGVGREGFTWKGRTRIGRKESWPDWTPPKDMLKRRPDLPRHMSGGEDNPLGARAMYLYSGNRDTMFRIHGSNEPWSIGQAVSSGCIRMLNSDVTDLFNHVKVGTTVNVL